MITQGRRTKEDEFEFNKDAGMYVCKAGHMVPIKRRLVLLWQMQLLHQVKKQLSF